MSLLAKAQKFLEQAQRELQDSAQRVLTCSHSPDFFRAPHAISYDYSAHELERELQLFCHRARIHHRARWMATRAVYLEPSRPIVIRQEVTIGETVRVRDLIGGEDGGKPCPDCMLPLAMGCLCASDDG